MIVALDCCFIVNLHVDYPCSKAKPNVVKEHSFNLASIIVRYCDTSFPCGLPGEESACNVGNLGSIPGLGRSPGEGKGYPLQYSGEYSGEFQGLYSPWGPKDSDMTERLSLSLC